MNYAEIINAATPMNKIASDGYIVSFYQGCSYVRIMENTELHVKGTKSYTSFVINEQVINWFQSHCFQIWLFSGFSTDSSGTIV
jgi:hypothetical protein